MQWVLLENGHRTTQITFGSNLMSSQFVIDIGRINKMFTLFRGGTRIEQYQNALLHSAYIRDAILEQRESVGIVQRMAAPRMGMIVPGSLDKDVFTMTGRFVPH